MAIRGSKTPEEVRQKISGSLLGRKQSMETCIRRNIALTGQKRSAEVKERMRQAQLGHLVSPETRKKISENRKVTQHTEETKLVLAQKSIAAWARLTVEERELRVANRPKPRNMDTSLERAVARYMNELGIRFISQYQVGKYWVDFFLPDLNLLLEVDGRYWHNLPGREARDTLRDQYLVAHGYNLLHIAEAEVFTLTGCSLKEKLQNATRTI